MGFNLLRVKYTLLNSKIQLLVLVGIINIPPENVLSSGVTGFPAEAQRAQVVTGL